MRIIIDAYNIIRTNPESKGIEEVHGNQKARDWLIDLCRGVLRNGEEWILVFDGDGAAAVESMGGGSLVVRYSAPRSADEVIRECGEDAVALHIPARIVSSDREVQVQGCDRQDSASFIDFVTKKNRYSAAAESAFQSRAGRKNYKSSSGARGYLPRRPG